MNRLNVCSTSLGWLALIAHGFAACILLASSTKFPAMAPSPVNVYSVALVLGTITAAIALYASLISKTATRPLIALMISSGLSHTVAFVTLVVYCPSCTTTTTEQSVVVSQVHGLFSIHSCTQATLLYAASITLLACSAFVRIIRALEVPHALRYTQLHAKCEYGDP